MGFDIGFDQPSRVSVPWWYRHIHSWRARMWIETGVWPRQIPDDLTRRD